jgi:hypothetical protein
LTPGALLLPSVTLILTSMRGTLHWQGDNFLSLKLNCPIGAHSVRNQRFNWGVTVPDEPTVVRKPQGPAKVVLFLAFGGRAIYRSAMRCWYTVYGQKYATS